MRIPSPTWGYAFNRFLLYKMLMSMILVSILCKQQSAAGGRLGLEAVTG